MSRRSIGADLRPTRSWAWTADAERRWLRAFRLLLTPEGQEPADCREQEDEHGEDRGRLRAGLDGAAGGEPDD